MNAAAMVETCLRHQQGDEAGIATGRGAEVSPSGELLPPSDRGRDDAVGLPAEQAAWA